MLISVNGRRLFFDVLGPRDAPAVVLLHPLAADSGTWAEQVPALLSAGYRVLRPDMRGHGGSDPAPGNAGMEQLVADVLLVLDAAAIDQAHLCGLSIGGMIAQGLAILHPGRVRSLLLCDTRAAAPADAGERWGPRIREVQAQNTMQPLASGTMQRWLSPAVRERQPVLWQQIRDTVASTTPQGYISCAAAIGSFNWIPRLGEIAVPTLVVCGADDPGADPAENREIAERVQDGQFRLLPGALHLPNVEDPALFNRIMLDWFGGQGG